MKGYKNIKLEEICMARKSKQIGVLLLTVLLLFMSGCSSKGETSGDNNSSHAPVESNDGSKSDSSSVSGDSPVSDNEVSTPENDTGIGLKNIKIDTADRELTEAQKAVITYFDNDYLDVPNYEFMRKYPQIFQDAQLAVYGTIIKTLSMDSENYKVVLWLNVTPMDIAWDYAPPGEYVILSGKTDSTKAWLAENDLILASGRYTRIETVDIDGTSYTVPAMNVYNTYDASDTRMQFQMAEKFD